MRIFPSLSNQRAQGQKRVEPPAACGSHSPAACGYQARSPARLGYLASLWTLAFAAVHVYWGLGGTLAVPFTSVALQDLKRNSWFLALGTWGVATACVAGVLLVRALLRPWGQRFPRWLLLGAAWAAGAGMAAYGTMGLIADGLRVGGLIINPDPSLARLHLFLWDPWWLLGGVLYGMVAWSCRRSVASRAPL